MDRETIDARIKGEQTRVLENIATWPEVPKKLWWLSFADDDGFRGAVIVPANEFMEAVMIASLQGINPGGECQGLEVPDEKINAIPDRWKNRLLSREDCAEFDKEMGDQNGQ